MDFALFKERVEEEGQKIWEGYTKLEKSNGEMPSYIFFFYPLGSAKVLLTVIPPYINKDEIAAKLHEICQEKHVLHSCLITEAWMATKNLSQTMDHIKSGGAVSDLPDKTEILSLSFSTVEPPHNHLSIYQIQRPQGLSPFLIKLPMPEADQSTLTGRFSGFYFKG